MCLDHSAHGLVPNHEMFRSPLNVATSFVDGETPKSYQNYYEGRDLGDSLPMWRVQTRGYTEERSVGVGTVSSPWGFEDSPDAERISGGINSKSPDSVAIGRQGPFLMWGFAAGPNDMTASGRAAFVNAVCYAKRFDGARVLVSEKARGRTAIRNSVWRALKARDGYDSSEAYYKKLREQIAAAKEAAKTRDLTQREQSLVKRRLPASQSFDDYRRKTVGRLPAVLRKECGGDEDTWLPWIEQNLGYVHGSGYAFTIDVDARAIGIDNRKLALLERAIADLEADQDTKRAQRVLTRYTGLTERSGDAWQSWLDEERDGLFFSDIGGFRWFSRTDPIASVRTLTAKTAGAGLPTDEQPIAARVLAMPQRAVPGEAVALALDLRFAPAWHAWADAGEDGYQIPMTLTLLPNQHVKPLGDWHRPAAHVNAEGQWLYEDAAVFVLRVELSKAVSGPIEIAVKVRYQACNAEMCLPPREEIVKVRIDVPTAVKAAAVR